MFRATRAGLQSQQLLSWAVLNWAGLPMEGAVTSARSGVGSFTCDFGSAGPSHAQKTNPWCPGGRFTQVKVGARNCSSNCRHKVWNRHRWLWWWQEESWAPDTSQCSDPSMVPVSTQGITGEDVGFVFVPAQLPWLCPAPLWLLKQFWPGSHESSDETEKVEEWRLHLPRGNEERSAKFTAQNVGATRWGQSALAILKIYLFVLKNEVVLWREIKAG